jgi:Ca2+-binding EF-hand superfamily protein
MASREQIVELSLHLFESYDLDDSGFLDAKEFKKVIKEVVHEINKTAPVDEKKLNQYFTIYDTNSDSKISKKEFVKAI